MNSKEILRILLIYLNKAKVFVDRFIDSLYPYLQPIYEALPQFKYKKYIVVGAIVLLIFLVFTLIFRITKRFFKVDHLKKGDKLLKKGKFEKARYHFLRVSAHNKAAFCSLKLTRIEEAAEHFMEAKEFEQAAKYYALDENYKKAANIYAKIGKNIEAAEMCFKGGNIREAAELYRSINLIKKAEEMYVKLEDFREAALMFKEKFFKDHASLPKNPSQKKLDQLRVFALKAGQYFNRISDFSESVDVFLKAGLTREAIVAYEKMGDYLKAADLCMQLDEQEKAAQYYVKASKFERAIEIYKDLGKNDEVADILEQSGKHAEASELRARLSLERQDIEHGAKHLENAGKYSQAAELFLKTKNIEKAAELYEKAGTLDKAAELLEEMEQYEKAAELYKSTNRFRSAAECYKKLKDDRSYLEMLLLGESYLEAAKHYAENDKQDSAIEVLQKIEESSPDYKMACNMLGKLFSEKNVINIAREKLNEAVEGKELNKRNLDLFYDLAVFQENNGEEREALKIYEKILIFDFYFKDVQDRRKILESKIPPEEMSAPGAASFLTGPSLKHEGAKTGPVNNQLINNRYELQEELGRGGMGVVYKAYDRSLDRLVALKFLPSDFIRDTRDIEKFINEAKSAAKLNHRHIVTIHNIDQVETDYFIVMEFVDGANLKEIIDMAHNLPYKTIHLITGQICDALKYAHMNNVVHRDIKNANIMWTNEKIVKITDFGLAKIMEDGLKTSTRVQGSPVYMSPEQVLGKEIDSRTDIYSLGISLYEMSTGKVPFERGDIGYHHLNTIPEPPEAIRSDMPEFLSGIIRKCINKRPEERFQNAQEILDVLANVKF